MDKEIKEIKTILERMDNDEEFIISIPLTDSEEEYNGGKNV